MEKSLIKVVPDIKKIRKKIAKIFCLWKALFTILFARFGYEVKVKILQKDQKNFANKSFLHWSN